MVDLNEHTMMFTLNGEVLLDDSGSELAFKDFEVGEGQCCVVDDTHNFNTALLCSLVALTMIPIILKNSWNLFLCFF